MLIVLNDLLIRIKVLLIIERIIILIIIMNLL